MNRADYITVGRGICQGKALRGIWRQQARDRDRERAEISVATRDGRYAKRRTGQRRAAKQRAAGGNVNQRGSCNGVQPRECEFFHRY